MKLPEDPKEKIKVLLLIAMSALAMISALTQGIMYLSKKQHQLQEQVYDMQLETKSARRDVASAEGCRPKNAKTLAAIVKISEHHVLQPILGNYRLGASEVIERVALESGVELKSCQEVGIIDVPKPTTRAAKNVFKAYSMRITMECSYDKTIEFVQRLESQNPYICITSLSIIGQTQKDPETHRIGIGIQWPIWVEPEMSSKMVDRMTEEQSHKRKNK